MKTTTIPGTHLACSRFIFGTDRLFSVGWRSQRIALLEAAVDCGFTHFDTAPYYGFGTAERDLAHVLRRHPSVTVTTKVGLYSAGGENQPAATIFLRKAAGRIAPVFSRPEIDFSIGRAQAALESSLRRLGRERIDLYLMHEPVIEHVVTDEWQRWLESVRTQGKIGDFGVAAAAAVIVPFLQTPALLPVVQMADSLQLHEADLLTQHGLPLQITYGYVTAARRAQPSADVVQVLRQALDRNHDGAIIVRTSRPDRLPQYARILDSSL